jgi:predicted SAM-dependent methyltransferase
MRFKFGVHPGMSVSVAVIWIPFEAIHAMRPRLAACGYLEKCGRGEFLGANFSNTSVRSVGMRSEVNNLLNNLSSIKYSMKRQFGRRDRILFGSYMRGHASPKLHIGCGTHILSGWLNSDYRPNSPNILHLNAAEPFAFKNDQFSFIFSEHMIEHVPYLGGHLMLSECFRVLKPNGILRISTPDLFFLIKLYGGERSQLENDYINWATTTFINYAPYHDAAFVINNFVRDWGHQFIYDETTLRTSLERAGFTNVTKCELNQSEHKELTNLENVDRMPGGFLKLETLTLEATKPL